MRHNAQCSTMQMILFSRVGIKKLALCVLAVRRSITQIAIYGVYYSRSQRHLSSIQTSHLHLII